MIVYFNGRFMPKEEVKVSPDDRGFIFADGAYEVIRSYAGRLFKVEAHLKRLERSLRELQISGPDMADVRDAAERLIGENNLAEGDATIYVQVTRGVAARRHAFPDEETSPTVYVTASAFKPSQKKWEEGVGVILVPDIRWARCDIKSLALLPNVLASQQAKESGAEEAVFVRDGVLTEGAHTNFGAVFDGQLVTAPRSNYILAGITREVVLDLCRELGIPVKEYPIFERELFEGESKGSDECMILGTTTEIMPVVRINDHPVGDGKPGPVTRKLQAAFRDLVKGG